MFDHEFDQLRVGQVFAGHMFFISRLVLAYNLVWLQFGAAQQVFQLTGGERFLDVVNAFVSNSLLSQDTLDLAARASGGLLIDDYFGLVFHIFGV